MNSLYRKFDGCDFTYAAIALTIVYAFTLATVVKYSYKLYSDVSINHRMMKFCLLTFLILNCLSRMTFFVGWTIDGPTCEPSMIQSDTRWISYLSNIPAALFVSAFSILVSSFVSVYHKHVSSMDWKNVVYHRAVVSFIAIVNLGLYILLIASLVYMARHDSDTTFQETLTYYLTGSSSLMALLFLGYGAALFMSVGGVMATHSDAQDLYTDMAALEGGDSPHRRVGRRSSITTGLSHGHARGPSSATHADMLIHGDTQYVVTDGTPRHTRHRDSPATTTSTAPPAPLLHRDARSLHSEDTALMSASASAVGLSDARAESSGQLSSLTHVAQHARAKLAGSQKKCLTVQLGACVRGAQTPSRSMSAYPSMDSASSAAAIDDMQPMLPALPRPGGLVSGPGSGSGAAWLGSPDAALADPLTLSVSADRLSQSSRNTFTAPTEANPMARMFRISVICSLCLLWRVAMLILMALLHLPQGPFVIIVYSLASEIIPVHLILRVFNDTSTNYTRDLTEMDTETPAISQDRNPESRSVSTEDVSAYQYQPPMFPPINRS